MQVARIVRPRAYFLLPTMSGNATLMPEKLLHLGDLAKGLFKRSPLVVLDHWGFSFWSFGIVRSLLAPRIGIALLSNLCWRNANVVSGPALLVSTTYSSMQCLLARDNAEITLVNHSRPRMPFLHLLATMSSESAYRHKNSVDTYE